MRILPVLDVRHGRAVRAVAGDRAHYGPLRSVLHDSTDPLTLARAARDAWGLPDLYLADLDAILGESAPRFDLFEAIAGLGLDLWVDPGVRTAEDVAPLIDSGVARVVVGLETVDGPDALAEIVARAGAFRVVFSLDLFRDRPVVDTVRNWGADHPMQIALLAARAGVRRIIVLDLDRVGTGQHPRTHSPGMDLRESADRWIGKGIDWLFGGGISRPEDIRDLARRDAWGALVGSALHDGRITADDLRPWRDPNPPNV